MPVVRLPSKTLPLSGRRVELGEILGRGSRTVAHRGILTSGSVRQRVVVKLFDAVPSDDAEGFVKNLGRAVARAALVQHPNVAQIFEDGVDAGRAYIVTEQVAGVSLAELMDALEGDGQRLTFDVALFVAAEVADALAGAYTARDHQGFRARILHGDLSARQVMLGFSGSVKVTDFEIGRASSAQSGVRSMRTVSSRLDMLAPELVHGEPTSARTDVFALGMLLRSMLIGPRFPEGIAHADALRMLQKGAVHLPTFHPRLPQELTDLLASATAVSAEERFPNARVMAWELRRVAFMHGVGDARPFLARALERAFPGASPFACEGLEAGDEEDEEDEDSDNEWAVDGVDEPNDGPGPLAAWQSASRVGEGAAYDSERPPPRPAPRASTAEVRDARPWSDSVQLQDRHRDGDVTDDSFDEEGPVSSDARRLGAARSDELAETGHLAAFQSTRRPSHVALNGDDDEAFDPEATVNLRD